MYQHDEDEGRPEAAADEEQPKHEIKKVFRLFSDSFYAS